MKALVGAFNQEKALVGAFSVIVQPVVEPMEHYTELLAADLDSVGDGGGAGPARQQGVLQQEARVLEARPQAGVRAGNAPRSASGGEKYFTSEKIFNILLKYESLTGNKRRLGLMFEQPDFF